MSEGERAKYRANAAECVELARIATNPATKEMLLQRAQEWLKLAYSPDEQLDRLLVEFNTGQMNRQPAQQQQSKTDPPEPGEPDSGDSA